MDRARHLLALAHERWPVARGRHALIVRESDDGPVLALVLKFDDASTPRFVEVRLDGQGDLSKSPEAVILEIEDHLSKPMVIGGVAMSPVNA